MINPLIVQAVILSSLGLLCFIYLVCDIWTTLRQWKKEGVFDKDE